jgi:hypothetical protein
MGSHILIESVCGERGGILLGLHGVRVHAEKEKIFWGEIGEIYSLLTFGFQITTRRIFYFYMYSPFCDHSQCHT